MDKRIQPNNFELGRFIGLVEGRTGVALPPSWEASIVSANSFGRGNIWFVNPAKLDGAADSSRVNSVATVKVGDDGVVNEGDFTWRLPKDNHGPPIDSATSLLTRERAYIATFNIAPLPFRLYAIDRGDGGKLAWSAKVIIAGAEYYAYEGPHWHDVYIRTKDKTVFVFGVANDVAYLNVFDAETGREFCRFSTIVSSHDGPGGEKRGVLIDRSRFYQ